MMFLAHKADLLRASTAIVEFEMSRLQCPGSLHFSAQVSQRMDRRHPSSFCSIWTTAACYAVDRKSTRSFIHDVEADFLSQSIMKPIDKTSFFTLADVDAEI